MFARRSADTQQSYTSRLIALISLAVTQLTRSPSHSRRAQAARRLSRHSLIATASVAGIIAVLMVLLDVREINLMPTRGTSALWPFRILTDFGKAAYVLDALLALLFSIALTLPKLIGRSHAVLIKVGLRLQFIFLSVLVPVIAGEIIKAIAGRGRPFVGGSANAFNFTPLAFSEAHASFPSGHAITSFALAFAVSSVWPSLRVPMLIYAVLIAATRLVLLAHHPSDVVAGALVGIVGAMTVRYWFAARRLGFVIRPDGAIMPLAGPSSIDLKRVARDAFAP